MEQVPAPPRPVDTMQPLAFGSFRNWRRLARENGVDAEFRRRAAFITAVSLATMPLRIADRLGATPDLDVADPVFVVGHWRSGTTYLHNLLCTDPQFGWVTTYQTLAPDTVRSGHRTLRPILGRLMPPTRMMDDVALSVDGPQEEEWAVANLSPYSFYHHFSFPRRTRHYFERYALLRSIPEAERLAWAAVYRKVVAVAGRRAQGRRLVLKNPANTARIPALLALYPGARFVHIHRDPYEVLGSTLHLYRTVYAIAALQHTDPAEVQENVLACYADMMAAYLQSRAHLPAGRLVEVAYGDLERRPLDVVETIYRGLGLSGFAGARPAMQAHVRATSSHRRVDRPLSREAADRVTTRWGFAVDAFGYLRRSGDG